MESGMIKQFVYEYTTSSLLIYFKNKDTIEIACSPEEANSYILENYGVVINFQELNSD